MPLENFFENFCRNFAKTAPSIRDTLEQMKQYFIEHQHAREIGDKKMMEKIEYHLTYINFHYECGLLATGQYDKLPEVIKNW